MVVQIQRVVYISENLRLVFRGIPTAELGIQLSSSNTKVLINNKQKIDI